MVEDFQKGFYTTSSQAKKEERKQETTSWQSSSSQLQQFFLILTTLTTWNLIRGTQEGSEKQAKSALHQEVSKFNPSGQMSMEQLIQVVLNLQEEVKRLKKDNDKLMENLSKQEEIESRIMSQERELSAFWNISQSQNCQYQNQQQKQTELGNKLGEIEKKLQQQIEINVQRGDPMLIGVIDKKKKAKPFKVVKRSYYCNSEKHL